eukprot:359999-Chlamydomonas_euryale.AAC.1
MQREGTGRLARVKVWGQGTGWLHFDVLCGWVCGGKGGRHERAGCRQGTGRLPLHGDQLAFAVCKKSSCCELFFQLATTSIATCGIPTGRQGGSSGLGRIEFQYVK